MTGPAVLAPGKGVEERIAFFNRLLEVLLPDGDGLVFAMEAYFDESERENGLFCVSGYAFFQQQAKKFSKEWARLLGHRLPFHMSDLHARQKQFSDLSGKQAGETLVEAVRIIKKRAAVGICISCNADEVQMFAPRSIVGYSHAYPICCHLAMLSLGNWLRDNGIEERVAYFFESGYKARGDAQRFMAAAVTSPDLMNAYRHRSHAFIDKMDAMPIQAADLLAWEFAKNLDDTWLKSKFPTRASLKTLLRSKKPPHSVCHIEGAALREYLSEVRKLSLAPDYD